MKFFLVIICLYFAYLIRDILVLLFVSLIFSAAIDPWVDMLQRLRIPRAIGVMVIYILVAAIIAGAVLLIVPPIIKQFNDLSHDFPYYVEKLTVSYETVREYTVQHGLLDRIKESVGGLEQNLTRAAGGIFSTVSGIFGGIVSFFLVLVITFYMVVEEDAMKKVVWSIAPPKDQTYVMQLINRMQRQVGYWMRGQLILMFLVGFFTWLGLLFIEPMREYALVLGLIAGIFEFIPYLGPTLSSVPAVLLAFTISPFLALLVIVLYIIIQQVEGNILVPKIMQRAVGLNPIVSIAVLMAGLSLGGVVGGLLSIPVATAASVIFKDWIKTKNNHAHA